MTPLSKLNYDQQDKAGHVWAVVWSTSLGLRLPVDACYKLANDAQHEFIETLEITSYDTV